MTSLEYLTDRLLLPLGAFFTTVFVGWIWGTDNSVEEATSYGKFKILPGTCLQIHGKNR